MKNKKILLVNPKPGIDWKYQENDPIVGPPVGLLSVGSALRQAGYTVKIIDAAVEREHKSLIEEEIRQKPLFVGLSVMTPQVPCAIAIADSIKQKEPDLPIVWGGIHSTLYPEQTLRDRSIDIVVCGLGEETVVELSQALNNKRDIAEVEGIGFKQNDRFCFTQERKFPLDMDVFPCLDYGLLDVEKYINRKFEEWNSKWVRTLMIYGSIGCPYRCRFCINSIIHKSRYVYKSAEKMLDEITTLIEKYNISHLNFRDEDFFVNKERVYKLLDGIKSRNLKFTWEANGRASYFNDVYISKEILKRLEECGCMRIGIGAESGVDRVLEMIKKDITTKQIIHSAEISRNSRIVLGYSFMMAIPGETNDEMVTTAKFIINLAKKNRHNYIIGPQIYRPYPGSELYNECLKYGLSQPQDLREWVSEYLRSDIIINGGLKKWPWIKDIRFVKIIHFYARCASLFVNKGNFLEILMRHIVSQISSFRIKHNFLYFPVEYYTYEKICLVRKETARLFRRWNP